MSNQTLELTVKHINDDGFWTEVIWESKSSFDINFPYKKLIRSGYKLDNRTFFFDNAKSSPSKCMDLIGKTFVAEVYYQKSTQQWRVEPRTLSSYEKLTPFQEAISKVSLSTKLESHEEKVTVNPTKITVVKSSVEKASRIGSGKKSHATKLLKEFSSKMKPITPFIENALQKDNLKEYRPNEYELLEKLVAMIHAEN